MKRIKLSLFDILGRLGQTAPKDLKLPPADQSESRVTHSIRFPTDVRYWITVQSEHLGVSIQDFVSLTMKGVMQTTNSPQTGAFDTLVMRFFMLFDAHNIATTDIPTFLPKGTLARSELRDSDKIIDALNDDVIQHLVNIFDINGDWLKGKSNVIYCSNSFYKQSSEIFSEIIRLKSTSTDSLRVIFLTGPGVKLKELTKMKREGDNTSVVYENVQVFIEREKSVGKHRITTYQRWDDDLPWTYWRSRYYLKALIYFCGQISTYVSAYSLPKKMYPDIVSGREFLKDLRSKGNHFTIDELAWDQDGNPERDELESIVQFFNEEKGAKYLMAAKSPTKIKNYQAFMDKKERLDIEYLEI
jgi:hypothetical protein